MSFGGFGGFGTTAATTTGGFGTAAPAVSSAGMFGSAAQPAATTSSFGFGAPATTSSFGFGAANTAQKPASTSTFGGGMFGSPAGTAATATSAFPSNAFGGGAGTAYGALGGAQQQNQSQWIAGPKLMDISMAYASKLDSSGKPMEVSTDKAPTPAAQPAVAALPAATTNSWGSLGGSFGAATPAAAATATSTPVVNKLCEFEVIAYNQSSSYRQKAYVRPPHVGYRRWLQADRENPDPENLTPVLVVGCDGLKKRFSSQCTKAEKIKSYADDLKEQLLLLERSLDGSNTRHEELKERQRKYFMRLLQVMRKLEVLRAKGISLTPVETRYREKVEELTSAIMVPYEKIQSLESSQAILERQSEAFALPSTVSEDDFDSLCAVLAKQRDGLKHLTDIARKDSRDIAIMEKIINSTATGRR